MVHKGNNEWNGQSNQNRRFKPYMCKSKHSNPMGPIVQSLF